VEWEVETTDEYDDWFLGQSEDGQASVRMKEEIYQHYLDGKEKR
jgi:hypothetical protein